MTLERKLVETNDNRTVDVSGKPHTTKYRSIPHIWFQRARDLPPFSFSTIRGMLLDPEVRLALATRAAPIYGVEFGYEVEAQAGAMPGMGAPAAPAPKQFTPGIECKHPEVGNYIYRQLQRIWRRFLPELLRAQVWGWSAGEVTLRLTEDGMVEIDKMLPRHASDCRLLKRDDERWGVEITRVEGTGIVQLPFPYGYIHNFNCQDGDDYGISACLGAYSPWADKWFQGGGLDVRRLFMHKSSYGGMKVGYPDGEVWVEEQNRSVPSIDIARQIAEETMAGGVLVHPSERDENGNEKWPIEWAQVPSNPQHILQYPKDLDIEIRHGFEIPDGVSDSAGSGEYAGKRVTVAGFYSGLDSWVVQITCDLKEQLLDPLVSLNFGFVPEYEIKHKPLAKQAMEQQGQANSQQQPQQQQPGTGSYYGSPGLPMDAGGERSSPAVQLMSLGAGELTVDEVVEAGRRVARLALQASDAKLKPDTCPREKLGCVMLEMPLDAKELIKSMAMELDESLLATDGVEQWPHTTLLYGIVGASVHEIVRAVRDLESIEITFGETTAFENEEHTVLKIDVESESIHALRESIAKTLPYVDTFPDYKPHITLAYLKPGAYPELYGPNALTGTTARITQAVASMDGQRINIPLNESATRMALDKPKVVKDDDLGEGSWITIGAERIASGEDGEEGGKIGGQAVFIGTDGRMKTGRYAGSTLEEAFGEGGLADKEENSPGDNPDQENERPSSQTIQSDESDSKLNGVEYPESFAPWDKDVAARFSSAIERTDKSTPQLAAMEAINYANPGYVENELQQPISFVSQRIARVVAGSIDPDQKTAISTLNKWADLHDQLPASDMVKEPTSDTFRELDEMRPLVDQILKMNGFIAQPTAAEEEDWAAAKKGKAADGNDKSASPNEPPINTQERQQEQVPDSLPEIIDFIGKFTKQSDKQTLQTTGVTNKSLATKVRDYLKENFPNARVYTNRNRMHIEIAKGEPGDEKDLESLRQMAEKFGLVAAKGPDQLEQALGDINAGKFSGYTLTKGKWQGSSTSLDGAPPLAAKQAATGLNSSLSPYPWVKLDEIGWWNGRAMKMLGVYVRGSGNSHRIHFQKKAMKEVKAETVKQRAENYREAINVRVATEEAALRYYKEAGSVNPAVVERMESKIADMKLHKRWTFAETNGDRYIEAIAAHEASHAVYYQSKAEGGQSVEDRFNQELMKEFSDKREQKQAAAELGEYAYKDGPVEYWAEIGCAVALGLQDDVPPKLMAAYQRTIESIKRQHGA